MPSLTAHKGNIGVAKIIADIVIRGYQIFLPMNEDSPFDLVVLRKSKLEKVQCKYSKVTNGVVVVRCGSSSNWKPYVYTPDQIDWLAVYDSTNDKCYYLPSSMLGKTAIWLRIEPTKNGQKYKNITFAKDFVYF